MYTDFKSAFETMPHDLLISTLPLKGVGPRLVRWITDFVSNRSFRVKVNGVLSRRGFATTGCPQGTVMDSLLFMFFVDQVKEVLRDTVRFYIYADDVKLVRPIRSPKD